MFLVCFLVCGPNPEAAWQNLARNLRAVSSRFVRGGEVPSRDQGTGGPEHKILKTGKCVELWQPKSRAALTLQLYIWTWQMFVAELSVGSAPVLFWAGVDMDKYDASQI